MHDLRNMRVYYIHAKNRNNQIIGTVCIAQGTGECKDTWSRGIAICSDQDTFDKKRGRAVAIGRCRRANGSWKTSMPIRIPFRRNGVLRPISTEFLTAAFDYGLKPECKSEFNVELTDYERRMVEKPEDAR